MAEDRYEGLTSGMNRKLLQTKFASQKQLTFRDTVLEIPNNMELGEFIRNWINENPENGSNIKYLNTEKCQQR
jgi:hypothetical protein